MSTNGWKTFRLDEIAVVQGGGTPRRSESSYFGGTMPWVTPTDLLAIGLITRLNKTKETITKAGLDSSSAKIIESGSVLFSSRASVGKIAVTDKQCATNQGFANFTPLRDKVDCWFLAFLLCRYIPDITALAGKTTFLEIPRGRLKAFKVKVPALPAQHRIVARIKECMERMEEIESLRAEVVAEANYLAPSFYAAIVEGSNWVRKKVGELIIGSRNGRSIKQDSLNANGHVLSLAAVHDVTLNLSARKPIVLPDDIAAKYSISVGDVFVSRSNTRDLVGLASVANKSLERVIYPDLLIKLDPRQHLIRSRFLAYALRTPESRKQIKNRAVGTSQSMVKISGQRLKDVEVPVPPLDIQDVLIERFDELHDLASGLKDNLRYLNSSELRQSILRKAFAGEL